MGFVHGAPAEKRAVQSVQRESARRASAVMREPLEWYDDKADKTTQGSGYLGPAVVPTPAIAAGTFLVGSFDLAAQIFGRMAVVARRR
jgi:hypothetical protein